MDERQKEFLLSELIGREVRVLKCSSKGLRGLSGTIADETRNTFLIDTVKGRKAVPKSACWFDFGIVQVQGRILQCRPEDRTKLLSRKLK